MLGAALDTLPYHSVTTNERNTAFNGGLSTLIVRALNKVTLETLDLVMLTAVAEFVEGTIIGITANLVLLLGLLGLFLNRRIDHR